MIKRHWFKALVIISFISIWFWKGCEVTHKEAVIHEPLPLPKVEEIKKPYVKPEVKPNIPVKKRLVYKKKEKALRDSVVKGPVIIGFEIVNGGIALTTIDSNDVVKKDLIPVDIKLPEGVDTLKANEKGVELVPEKKTWAGKQIVRIKKGIKQIGNGVAVVGAIAITGVVAVIGAPVVVVVAVGIATTVCVVAVIASED